MNILYEIDQTMHSDGVVVIRVSTRDHGGISVGTHPMQLDLINQSIIDRVFDDMKSRFKKLYQDSVK